MYNTHLHNLPHQLLYQTSAQSLACKLKRTFVNSSKLFRADPRRSYQIAPGLVLESSTNSRIFHPRLCETLIIGQANNRAIIINNYCSWVRWSSVARAASGVTHSPRCSHYLRHVYRINSFCASKLRKLRNTHAYYSTDGNVSALIVVGFIEAREKIRDVYPCPRLLRRQQFLSPEGTGDCSCHFCGLFGDLNGFYSEKLLSKFNFHFMNTGSLS